MNYIPKFRELFPELNHISREKMCDRWSSLGIDFYTEEKTSVSFWIRLTLPFALIVMIFMFLFLPINFIITGKWGYGYSKNNFVYNWLKSLF